MYLKSLWGPWRGGPFWRIEGGEPEGEIPFSLVFKGQKSPIKATWYTGVLRLLHGERVGSVPFVVRPRYPIVEDLYISAARYGPGHTLYETDTYLGVVQGNIVSEHLVNNKAQGASQSVRDWAWVASGSGPIKDDLKWYDLRDVTSTAFSRCKKPRKSFRTRGIYYIDEKRTMPRLWIPPTLATPRLVVELKSLPGDYEGGNLQHVQIEARFEEESADHCILHVDSIRPLKPGETMHHPDFKPPEKPAEK